MSKTAIQLLKDQYAEAHGWLEGVMVDVNQKLAEEVVNEKAMTIGGQYIHIVSGLDDVILGMLAGKTPLNQSEWKDKKGYSPDFPSGGDQLAWSREVEFELDKVKQYCVAVHDALNEYLDSLTDEDLEKEVDLSSWGMGMKPASYLFNLMLINTASHTGEISNMKGHKGFKGYQF